MGAALNALAAEWLLDYKTDRVFAVREYSLQSVSEGYEIRAVLEGLACRLAASRPPNPQVTALFEEALALGEFPSGEDRGGSRLTVAIHCDHLDEVFDAEWGECENLEVGGAVYPDDPVFGLHANGEVMEVIDALAEFFRDAIDGRDGMDLVELHDQAA